MSHAFSLDEPELDITAFDTFLTGQAAPELWELVAGRIFAMNNPTDFHEKIVGNIGAPLKLAMDERGCHVFFGGMRVQRSDDARGIDKPRPDLLVRCGALTGKTYATDPLVIVEVLSPSTMDIDRGDKLRFYKRLPTLCHIVLIYQDQMRIEHYRKSEFGWTPEVLTRPQDLLVFDAVRFEIAVGRIYFAIHLGD